MRPSLLPLLRCPVTGAAPLRLVGWKWERGGRADAALAGLGMPEAAPLGPPDPRAALVEGALVEPLSGRWFPVADGIPHLVRDPLRHAPLDAALAPRLADLPVDVRAALSPRLDPAPRAPAPADLAPADLALLDEDRYWGGFFRLHFDAGDRSIFDMEARGTHPTFWPAGVREPDRRDADRRWGVWPDHLGRWLFDDLAAGAEAAWREVEPPGEAWAWDAGCGGGQFALAAARAGYLAVGTDLAADALRCAAARAAEAGVAVDYVRAENARPPFREAAFRLVLCKDTIHHERDVAAMLDAWTRTMAPGCRVLFYEHCGRNALARRMLAAAQRRLLPRITRRHPRDPTISPYFQTESANEDAGRDVLRRELAARFPGAAVHEEVRLYHDLDALLWYAFGRLRRPARALAVAARWADPLLRAAGGAEYLGFKATWRGNPPRDSPATAEGKQVVHPDVVEDLPIGTPTTDS